MRALWVAAGLLVTAGCHTLLGPPPAELAADDTDALTLAADAIERGDRPAAATHLEAYVAAHPGEPMFRAQLAELLWKLDRPDDARAHFERFVAAAQDGPPAVRGHLVHAHTRLMLIARAADDRAAEEFHRGAGLVRLADQLADAPDEREAALGQAVKALTAARNLRPGDPRPHAYLALAHARGGDARAAAAARAAARSVGDPAALTPAERRELAARDP